MTSATIQVPEELKRIDSRVWTFWLLFNWAIVVLAMAGVMIVGHWWSWVAAIVVIGNRQHGLAIVAHENVHRLAFRNRVLNDLLGNLLVAWNVGWTIEGYREWHMEHHAYTGTARDPELALKARTPRSWALHMTFRRLAFDLFLDVTGRGFLTFLAGFGLFPPPRPWQLIGPVLWPIALSMLLISYGLWIPIALWFISFGTTYGVFMRLRMWVEHVGSENTHRVKLTRLEALILGPHNVWIHWEHHRHPNTPFYHLPALRALMPSPPIVTASELWGTLFTARAELQAAGGADSSPPLTQRPRWCHPPLQLWSAPT